MSKILGSISVTKKEEEEGQKGEEGETEVKGKGREGREEGRRKWSVVN